MRTIVVSDFHLGLRSGRDVLRAPVARTALLEALAQADRLVLLGDIVELRQMPRRHALERAQETLGAIGEAMAGREVVLVPGNHDHALVAPWLEERAAANGSRGLETEERIAPAEAAPAAAAVAGLLAPARVELAYPGVWLREDVYATHGHYLDLHATVPKLERLAAGAMSRFLGGVPDAATPDDYERRLAPLYAWIDAVAQRTAPGRAPAGEGVSSTAWKALTAEGPRTLRARAFKRSFPLAVRGLDRLGLGPLSADLSGASLTRASLEAMLEVVGRLRIDARHVVFGHSHRAGPLPGESTAAWGAAGGALLVNSGSWVYDSSFATSPEHPYWPGVSVVVEDEGPPRLERLLAGTAAADLSQPPDQA